MYMLYFYHTLKHIYGIMNIILHIYHRCANRVLFVSCHPASAKEQFELLVATWSNADTRPDPLSPLSAVPKAGTSPGTSTVSQ